MRTLRAVDTARYEPRGGARQAVVEPRQGRRHGDHVGARDDRDVPRLEQGEVPLRDLEPHLAGHRLKTGDAAEAGLGAPILPQPLLPPGLLGAATVPAVRNVSLAIQPGEFVAEMVLVQQEGRYLVDHVMVF